MTEFRVEKIDIVHLFRIFWKKKEIIIGVAGLFALIVLGINLVLQKQYKATASFLSISEGSGVLGSQSLSLIKGFGLGPRQTDAIQSVEILKSRTITRRVIERLGSESLAQRLGLKKASSPLLLEGLLTKTLSVDLDKRSNIIRVSTLQPEPQLAADIANAYVDTFSQFLRDRAVQTNVQTIDAAEPSEKKYSPRTIYNTGVAFVASLLLVYACFVFADDLLALCRSVTSAQ